ncbi:MAG: gamma-glutamylcyclotransferase [Gammaproteobacteria bacterium]|nr:gamma-glutamylcyclotransferase [Gammaproteobacteria bacterium]
MKLNYFAFGSNLSSPRLLQRLPEVSVHCVATLTQHQLCWRKNDRGQSGKCDIEFTGKHDDIVYGVIYLMTHDDKLELDIYETTGFGYDHKHIEVTTIHGESIKAFTYYALDIDHSQQPFHWYKEHVLRGALEHDFPSHYVEHIRTTRSIDDHDVDRHHRELSIYLGDL